MARRNASGTRGPKRRGGWSVAVCAALSAVAVSALVPSAAGAVTGTVHIVSDGRGQITVDEPTNQTDPATCPGDDADDGHVVLIGTRTDLGASECTLSYEIGTSVTIRAQGLAAVDPGNVDEGPATTFVGWSDDRCPPPGAACTVTVGADPQSIAAIFSPQRVSWRILGAGSVTSPPSAFGGLGTCDADGADACAYRDYAFDAVTSIGLTADASPSTWMLMPPDQTRELQLCDSVVGSTCYVTAGRPWWAVVSFGLPFPNGLEIPPEIDVRFHVFKSGSGSGAVAGNTIACGTNCAVTRKFGSTETLTATPDSGSRFDGWRAACGTAPTCRLAVGPVTAVTAVFEKASSQGGGGGQGGSSGVKALAARILRLNVRGKGRKRTLLIRLQVSVDSTVRGRLVRGRRQIASKRWRVSAGSHLLRFRVPRKARPGVYKLRLTVAGAGQTKRISQRVRLRR
jgi:Divergent InlB B-repeat domain